MDGFSLLSWNVEGFRGDEGQIGRVARHIASFDPDVLGLFEVESVDILELMSNRLPGYDYQLTEGPQSKEILVGMTRAPGGGHRAREHRPRQRHGDAAPGA